MGIKTKVYFQRTEMKGLYEKWVNLLEKLIETTKSRLTTFRGNKI